MAILRGRFLRAGFVASTLSTLLGCERVVDLQLPGGGGQLVIEARLERLRSAPTGKQRFVLTTSQGYSDRGAPPPAHGAVVVVSDDLGRTNAFVESRAEPGVYETNSLIGEVGRRYTLTVDYQSDRYVATATLLPVAPVDSIRVEADTQSGDSLRCNVVFTFRDPPGVKNFYQWDVTAEDSGRGRTKYTLQQVGEDNLEDGREIVESLLSFDRMAGSAHVLTVTVRQTALSEETFRYFSALNDQTSSTFSPFAVPAANLRGNVSNVTNPSHRALGFFQAGEVVEIRQRLP